MKLGTYEGMFLLDTGSADGLSQGISELHARLEKSGAKIDLSSDWGERRLEQRIGRQKRAHYRLVYFHLSTDEIAPLRRDLQLSENVLRHLILAHEEDRYSKLLDGEKARVEEVDRKTEEETSAAAEEASSESESETKSETKSEAKAEASETPDAAPSVGEEAASSEEDAPVAEANEESEASVTEGGA